MRVTGTAQREAWQAKRLPPAEQVTGGVWSIPVPIPDNPLRYVLSYLLEHRSGFVMVDTGWDHPAGLQALTRGLDDCGIPVTAITAILVTHVHPDHHGLSAAIAERSGAWIGMHEYEDDLLVRYTDWTARTDRLEAYLRWCGAPAGHTGDITARFRPGNRITPMVRPDKLIGHGELIDAPGLTLRAVWTPGHTPGHLCFHDETRRLLLTGDHVLPRITPNIGAYDLTSAPLGDYLDSLAALHGLDPAEVLPGHEYRFSGLDDRLDGLAAHHDERLAEIAAVLAADPGGQSAWRIAEQVSWSRPWTQLSGFPRQAALGEVSAHLRHLAMQGRAACADVAGTGLWRPAGPEAG